MATLTKKDLLEAIEDMPMNAEIHFVKEADGMYVTCFISSVTYSAIVNTIMIC